MDNNTYCKKGKLKGALVATSGLVQDSYESKTFAKVILELLRSFDLAMSKHSWSNDIYVYVYSFLFNLNVNITSYTFYKINIYLFYFR